MNAAAPAIPGLVERNFRRLIERLQAEQPAGGYRDPRFLPPLSVTEITTVLRHEPLVLVSAHLEAEPIICAFETCDPERSTRARAHHLTSAVESAVRRFLFAALTWEGVPPKPTPPTPRIDLDDGDGPIWRLMLRWACQSQLTYVRARNVTRAIAFARQRYPELTDCYHYPTDEAGHLRALT